MNPTPSMAPRQSRPGLLDAPPRTTFTLGIFVGAAATAIIALVLVLPRIGDTSSSKNSNTSAVAGTTDTNQAAAAQPTEDPTKVPEPTKEDHYRGVAPDKADVVLVEYSDIQCPYCSKFHPTLQQAMDEYKGKVSWVYRHFPLTSIHPQAQPAAVASECVAEVAGNDVFWQFLDTLYENQTSLSADYFKQVAKDLKVNESKFTACLEDNEYDAAINQALSEGSAAGINGTPGTFIFKGTDLATGRLIAGAYPYETVKQTIDALLE